MFRVGQKVVCVDASSHPGMCWGDGEAPEQGRIYTISKGNFISPHNGELLVQLAEISRHPTTMMFWGHLGYGIFRFRPLVERKTDISILKALLVPGAKILEGVE